MSDGVFIAAVACTWLGLGWVVLHAHVSRSRRERFERLEEAEWRAFWDEEETT
jgi:hypothetical protein